jgi:thymidylate kinase
MQSATNKSHKTDTPVLIIIRGVPGSGKSLLAAALQESLGKERVVVLDPDAIDSSSPEYHQFSEGLSAEGVDEKFHPYRWSRSRAFDAIANSKIIIWNQGFMNFDGLQKTIGSLETYAAEQNIQLPVLIVEVEISHETAKKRIAGRVASGGHDVPDDTLTGFVERYESFAGKGYQTMTVDGQDDINNSVTKVLQVL